MSYLKTLTSPDWLPIANYKAEQDQFRQLLKADSPIRILWFYGEPGIGKSRLVRACLNAIPSEISYIPFTNAGSTTVDDILLQVGRRIRWQPLTNLPREAAFFGQSAEGMVSEATYPELNVVQSHIKQALDVADPVERNSRSQNLTEAWLADLQKLTTPFLLILDNMEQASQELDEWLRRHMLPKVAEVPLLRFLIASEKPPTPDLSWQTWAKIIQLKGIPDPTAWLPVAQALGRNVTLEYLAGACKLTDGNPAQMVNFIQMIAPINTAAAAPGQIAAILNQNLNYFNDLELRQLCFDLDVDYQMLAPSQSKAAKGAELISLMTRDQRLPDLLAACTYTRPELNWKL